MTPIKSFAALCAVLVLAPSIAKADPPAPLGVSYWGWRGSYRNADKQLATFKEIGFPIVAFVPTYAYVGLDKHVVLSHNFTHHIEIADDFVARMPPARRKALARYIRGLDAIALSQYMDLTVALPPAERGKRLPTADEVAAALVGHEKAFRADILGGALGLKPKEIPPLHIGEFGVGRGGLQHPNLWAGDATPAQEKELAREIARGHEGLVRYLALPAGRSVQSAVLWVTGAHYDVFGWESAKYGNPEAAAVIRGALHPPAAAK